MALSEPERARLTQAGLNLIQQAISIYDVDLKLAVCNRPFRDMFNLPTELVTPGADFGETIRYLVERGEYGDVDDIDTAVAQRVKQARAFEPHYLERLRPDGRTISVEGSPLPQGGWVTVYTDISAIKQQETLLRTRSEELSDQVFNHAERLSQTNRELAATIAALEEAKRQLTEIEARTRTVTEMMPAHIAHVGTDRRYTYSNRRLSAIMPSRPSDIVGLSIDQALGADAFAKIRPHFEQALSGTPSTVEFTHADTGRRVRAVFTPDIGGDGAINGVYIMSTDMTEEAQARAALTQTRKRELAAQLTSGLAHDFANLLTIILGMQSQLQRHAPTDEARELIAATQGAARRGGVLLDRIASVSGKREMHPVATDLREFLSGLNTMAAPTLPKNVTLETHMNGGHEPVMLDTGGVQDALLNLILNARDAIGHRPGRITISATAVGDTWLDLSVTDTGHGFSDTALKHAMDPFFTTKGAEGSGLGLAMVYDVAKMSGGRVYLANTGTGAQATLRVPLRPADQQCDPMLVLLVEDNDDIRTSVREMLTQLGHSVIEAASADEAETLADLPGLNMVLSDINIRGERTGVDLLRALDARDHPAHKVLMTSLPPQNPLRQSAADTYSILQKPFTVQSLAGTLSTEAHA